MVLRRMLSRRYSEVPPFLHRREAAVLDGTSSTMLLTRNVQVRPLPFVVRAPAQDLSLGADRVVAVMHEIAAGHHAGLLPGMDGDVRGDALSLQ